MNRTCHARAPWRRPAFLYMLVLAAILGVGAFIAVLAHAGADTWAAAQRDALQRTARLAAVSARSWTTTHRDECAAHSPESTLHLNLADICPHGVSATADVACTSNDGGLRCTITGRARSRDSAARYDIHSELAAR